MVCRFGVEEKEIDWGPVGSAVREDPRYSRYESVPLRESKDAPDQKHTKRKIKRSSPEISV